MPNPHAIAVMLLMIVAFYLYTREWARIEIVSLGLLTGLLALFHLFPFSGPKGHVGSVDIMGAFGNQALVTICCLMVLGSGLTLTGALEPLVRLLARFWKFSATGGLLVTLVFAAGASAFINDTPVLVLMLPMLIGLAGRTGTPASKTLMPVNFAILCGGTLTSIGTSTNILVLSIATDLGLPPIGVFDFTMISGMALMIAIPYLWLVAPRLLPANSQQGPATVREYAARLIVEQNSRLCRAPTSSLSRVLGRAIQIARIHRGSVVIDAATAQRFEPGDIVDLIDTPDGLQEISTYSKSPLIDRETLEKFVADRNSQIDQRLAEMVLTSESPLKGRSLRETRFAEQFGVAVVGVYRTSELEQRPFIEPAAIILQAGDVLLLQGREDRIDSLGRQRGLMLVSTNLRMLRTPKAPWALAIMGSVIVLAATRIMPIDLAALLGVMAMLLTRCVLIEGLGRALSLQVVLLVASSVALGQSLVSTGAADWIASGVALSIQDLPPAGQLAAFIAFAAVMTNFVSNSAAAAIGTPIAMSLAALLHEPAQPFVLAILFGANLSFATPMAYQTNLLVMSAGGYSFKDFVRTGTPLVILMVVALSILLARRYGL